MPSLAVSTVSSFSYCMNNVSPPHEIASSGLIKRIRGIWIQSSKVRNSSQSSERDSSSIRLASNWFDKQWDKLNLRQHVFMPDSVFRQWWDLTMVILVIYCGVMIPVTIAFLPDDNNPIMIGIEDFSNVFFIVDIILNFVTAIKIDGVIVNKKRDIAFYYVRSWFFIDVISSFPTEIIAGSFASSNALQLNKLLRLLRIFKLFRVFRIARVIKRLQELTNFNPAVLRLFKLLFILAFVWHLIGCSYWLFASLAEDFAINDNYFARDLQNNWIPAPELWCSQDYVDRHITMCVELPHECYESEYLCPAPVLTQYMDSFFWAVMSTTGIGRFIQPSTFLEHLFSTIMISLGVLLYAVIIGSASSALSNLDTANTGRRQKIESINQYLRQKKVPGDLQKRIRAYYDYMWSSHQTLNEKDNVLNDLHPSLKLELHINLNQGLIENVPMFKMITDKECLIDMIEKLIPKIYIPGEYIVLQHELGSEMYVIVRGTVHVLVGDDKSHIATLHSGDVFGETALITRTTRNASVMAMTYCDTLVLVKEDFDEVMKHYPDFFSSLQRLATGKIQGKGWERVRYTLEMAHGIKAFGGEVQLRTLLMGKSNMDGKDIDLDLSKVALLKVTANRSKTTPVIKLALN